jgi:predicted transcriptional regulator
VAQSTKQILQRLIDELPDDATIAEVHYRLYVIDAVDRGRGEIAAGTGVPHEQVAAELRAKWSRPREQ